MKGDDFKFSRPDFQYQGMGLLISHINSNPQKYNLNLKYSLVSSYFEKIEKNYFPTLSVEKDFLPYTVRDHLVNKGCIPNRFLVWLFLSKA
jgi:hypothetical protein